MTRSIGDAEFNGRASSIINTDALPGNRIFVGNSDPSILYTMQDGDLWIEMWEDEVPE
jgi:hypothetical protein